jgi:hypothetical protein
VNLGRTYELIIQNPQGEQKIITLPFTLEFDVTRNTLASTNETNLTITNLGVPTRNWLFKDRYNLTQYWQMQLRAGYQGKTQYTLFLGNIMEAYSVKEGPDWKTKINAYDGLFGLQNGFVSQSLAAGSSKQDLTKAVVNSMPNIAEGLFGKPTLGDTTKRGQVVFGFAKDVLDNNFPGAYFIDLEKLNILGDNEIDPSSTIVLDSDQLLTTPQRRETFIDVKTMFIPQAKIGIVATLNSNYPIYNGQYKVIGMKHTGIISDSVGGELTTQFNLYAGAGAFTPVAS